MKFKTYKELKKYYQNIKVYSIAPRLEMLNMVKIKSVNRYIRVFFLNVLNFMWICTLLRELESFKNG